MPLKLRIWLISESTEYWCGQNLIDGAVTAIQTQILVGVAQSEPREQAALKVSNRDGVTVIQTLDTSGSRLVVK